MIDLFKPIKIPNDKKTLVWSDLHLGQECRHWDVPLYEERGFDSLQDHDEALMQQWDERSCPETTAFLLGDTFFGKYAYESIPGYFNRMMFDRLYLMVGNHFAGLRRYVSENAVDGVIDLGLGKEIVLCPNYIELYYGSQPIVMSHYAIASWNGQGKGSIMLHGHSHKSLYSSELGRILYKGRIEDVGVENYPFPRSLSDIVKDMKDKPTVSFDHHSGEIQTPFS